MIAALHIFGAMIAFMVVSTLLFFFGVWIDKTNARRAMEEASIALAVPISELSSAPFESTLIQYFGTKYSDDLLKNRISDFVGLLLVLFNWLAFLAELAILGFVVWFTLTDNQSNAVYAWFVLPIPVLTSVVGLCVYFICKVLTGRFPAQAKNVRKILAQSINQASRPMQRAG